MERTHTVVIGAGQAGLAMSRCLTDAAIDHVVLERGRVAERWRSERWDSLRLLTPNWMSRLPGIQSPPSDAHGFMSKDDVVDLFEDYAASFRAPVREGVTVTSVRSDGEGFRIATSTGDLVSDNVVVATGQCGVPAIPTATNDLAPELHRLHASRYRNPSALPTGGVLVVGAGASGIQIADELAAAGRTVVLSTGRHARALRSYRGMDLWWWLERTGSLDDTVDDVGDIDAARRTPSLGLTGSGGGRTIDLGTLAAAGVTIAGRLTDARGTEVHFDGNLLADVARSEDRLRRLLDRFDALATAEGLDTFLGYPTRPLPVRIPVETRGWLDLAEHDVRTVLWATGYRPSYPWLHVPAIDERGEIAQRRGVTAVDGLFVLGLRFQWRRGSHFIDGVGRDAEYLAGRIVERSLQSVA
jgi:putative flavoprotein involved in K+ transport